MPLIARWPGRVPVGESGQMLTLLDFFATIAALLDHPLPPGAGTDGINLLPVLLGQTRAALRDTRFSAALVPEPLLFNLADDSGDTRHLAATHREKVAEMAARLEAITRRA